jgi:hypothetical protein
MRTKRIISSGEIIEEFPDDEPCPDGSTEKKSRGPTGCPGPGPVLVHPLHLLPEYVRTSTCSTECTICGNIAPFPKIRPDCVPYNAHKRPADAFRQPLFRDRAKHQTAPGSATGTRLCERFILSDCKNTQGLGLFWKVGKRSPIRAPIGCQKSKSGLKSGPDECISLVPDQVSLG